ncbi:hypothetical protein [uncultured Thomasclavelia sp.]|uniref:hypothetical protein n=1 Tax=uncultured Thomasclavelia sp. TaxID=3025759 RepID=UPI0025965C07|nr:hypothetical protein [uncultured Thomasclavelia sp.]
MEKIKVIRKPDITMYPAIRVTKDTEFNYNNENVKQTLKNLEFHSKTTIKGENYTSVYDTTIKLKDGDILVFEAEDRGYIKPVEEMATVKETIEELEYIKEV